MAEGTKSGKALQHTESFYRIF